MLFQKTYEYRTRKCFWESIVVIGIPTLYSQYFDIILGFPTCGFWGEKDKRAGNRPGMDTVSLALRRMLLLEAVQSIWQRSTQTRHSPRSNPQFWEFCRFPTLDSRYFESNFPIPISVNSQAFQKKKNPTAVGFPETLARLVCECGKKN